MSTKCVVSLGWKSFVLDTNKAITLLEILDGCEVYEEEWHREADGKPSYTTYHVYPTEELGASLKLLPSNIYNVAKLAGKPEK
jgi:hypothetical protein